MKFVAKIFLTFGVGSTALHFFDREFVALSWIEHWGDEVAWTIRGSLILVGGILFLLDHLADPVEGESDGIKGVGGITGD